MAFGRRCVMLSVLFLFRSFFFMLERCFYVLKVILLACILFFFFSFSSRVLCIEFVRFAFGLFYTINIAVFNGNIINWSDLRFTVLFSPSRLMSKQYLTRQAMYV